MFKKALQGISSYEMLVSLTHLLPLMIKSNTSHVSKIFQFGVWKLGEEVGRGGWLEGVALRDPHSHGQKGVGAHCTWIVGHNGGD